MTQLIKPAFTNEAFYQSIAVLGEHGVDAYHAFLEGFADDEEAPEQEEDAISEHDHQRREYMMLAGLE